MAKTYKNIHNRIENTSDVQKEFSNKIPAGENKKMAAMLVGVVIFRPPPPISLE